MRLMLIGAVLRVRSISFIFLLLLSSEVVIIESPQIDAPQIMKSARTKSSASNRSDKKQKSHAHECVKAYGILLAPLYKNDANIIAREG